MFCAFLQCSKMSEVDRGQVLRTAKTKLQACEIRCRSIQACQGKCLFFATSADGMFTPATDGSTWHLSGIAPLEKSPQQQSLRTSDIGLVVRGFGAALCLTHPTQPSARAFKKPRFKQLYSPRMAPEVRARTGYAGMQSLSHSNAMHGSV